jgi:hypothetical protein
VAVHTHARGPSGRACMRLPIRGTAWQSFDHSDHFCPPRTFCQPEMSEFRTDYFFTGWHSISVPLWRHHPYSCDFIACTRFCSHCFITSAFPLQIHLFALCQSPGRMNFV